MGEEIEEKFEKEFGKDDFIEHEKYPFEFVFEEEVGKKEKIL